jgi:hypothetical protein
MMTKNLYGLMLFLLVALAGSTALAQQDAREQKGTLYERARKEGGRLVWRYRPDQSVTYANVEELAKRSEVIVVGRTIAHKARLRPDGKLVTEDFVVKVLDVIKGDLPSRTSVTVSVPGGSYRFPDKTHAVVIPTSYQRPEDLRIYVFFLNKKGPDSKGYDLASESQGLFDVTSGKVQPADQVKEHPVVMKYREMDAPGFLSEIHRAVPRTKKH